MGTVEQYFRIRKVWAFNICIWVMGVGVLAINIMGSSHGRPLSCIKRNSIPYSSELVCSDAHLSGALSLDRDPPSGLASDFHDYFY